MEHISFVQRARLDTGASEESGATRQPLNDAAQNGVDLQEMRSGLLHELPILSEVSHSAKRHRGSRTGARHDDRQRSTHGAHEPAGSKAAQPKKPSQLEQARTALQNAKSAGLPQGVITSLEQEVDKLAVMTAEARPIGAQIDAAKARLARALKAEESLKERWLMLEEQVKANQQEKTAAQASLEELTSKAKMGLERGGDHNHHEAALEQILELTETNVARGTCPT